eukprot:14802437-Alexandrium_andersonii.AAC.1
MQPELPRRLGLAGPLREDLLRRLELLLDELDLLGGDRHFVLRRLCEGSCLCVVLAPAGVVLDLRGLRDLGLDLLRKLHFANVPQ